MAPPPARARWGPIRSLLLLSPVLIAAPWYAYSEHRCECCLEPCLPWCLMGIASSPSGTYCRHVRQVPPHSLLFILTYVHARSINPVTSLPQISEAQILAHAKYLSEDIGYRTVGTREHALGDAWMYDKAKELKQQCDAIVKAVPGRKLECEVWRQQGSGSHRCVSLSAVVVWHTH